MSFVDRAPWNINPQKVRLGAEIVGWGKYAPAEVRTNDDLARMVDTSDAWIRSRTGIAERHIADQKEWTSTLAVRAARRALAVAGTSPRHVDAVIVATVTPDRPVPSAASVVQGLLGATQAAAFDVNAGCTGFIYSLVIGCGLIASGMHTTVLVIGADTLSRITDWSDRNTCVLFGDGAGAVVLRATNTSTSMIAATLGSDGLGADVLQVPAGGSQKPASENTIANHEHFIRMNGQEVFRFAVGKIVHSVRHVLDEAHLDVDDIKLLVPHQANKRIIEAAAHSLKIPMGKFFLNIDRYGNTSAASIPMALVEAVESGRLMTGDHVLLVGFGAGLTWGAAIMRWGAPRVRRKLLWRLLRVQFAGLRQRVRRAMRRMHYWLDATFWRGNDEP